ncbi:MAG: hypothetical protein U9P71_03090 [Campylobacterota bacterium]|nr:hypothetical protein [Campylobacterota bacterium]
MFIAIMMVLPLSAKQLAVIHKVDGSVEAKYNTLVEKSIKSVGYKLSDPHKRVNDGYKEKYGSTDLDVLSFMSIANTKEVNKLLAIDPRLAGFAPFNMLIYKRLSENSSYVGHLVPEVMLDIVGVTDADVRAAYIKSFEPLDALIEKEIGGEKYHLEYSNLPEKSMMNFEMEFERAEDLEDSTDEIQEKFEEIFEDREYIIAGYLDLKEADEDDALKDFDAFWVYSLCHFKFSYTVFDGKEGVPEAGLFAPCSMYMYIKKGTNKLVVGMPRLATWAATLNITSKEKLELVKQLDIEIPSIMKELGAVETSSQNPLLASTDASSTPQAKVKTTDEGKHVVELPKAKVDTTKTVVEIVQNDVTYLVTLPKVPRVTSVVPTPVLVTIGSGYVPRAEVNSKYDRSIGFSKRTPPVKVEAVAKDGSTSGAVGEVKNNRASAYLRGPLMSPEQAKAQLESAGFNVLSTTTVDKKGDLTVLVFTNDALEKMANKKERGFMASLRLLVDKKNKQITISNPIYFAKAFLQDDVDEKASKAVLNDIKKVFAGLKDSTDNLKHNKLAGYHFMMSMPYYEDMIEVGSAGSSKELLNRLIAKNGAKNLIFSQQLSEDRILVGIKLDKRTRKFIKKTGFENALLLPYPVLIENGEAKILDPKYYIAISYPMLKMSQFMKIATVPGAIENDSIRLFK